jgi:hypothetical protein
MPLLPIHIAAQIFNRNARHFLLLFFSFIFMYSCEPADKTTSPDNKPSHSVPISDESAADSPLNGSYCADVTYLNPNTGTSSNYSLLVDVRDNRVICLHWPQGGVLDLDHFGPAQIFSDSTSKISSFEGKEYRVKIVGPASDCSDRFEGQLQQCKGRTKQGNRCKRMTDNPNGYCYQHGGN